MGRGVEGAIAWRKMWGMTLFLRTKTSVFAGRNVFSCDLEWEKSISRVRVMDILQVKCGGLVKK
jgi:hypothetical protein